MSQRLPWAKFFVVFSLSILAPGCSFAAGARTGFVAGAPRREPYCYADGAGAQRCFDTKQEMESDYRELQHTILMASIRRKQEAAEQRDADALADTQRLRAVGEARRRTKEQEERAEQAERRTHQEHLARLAADPNVAVPTISSVICGLKHDQASLKASLQRENRVTQASGVIDLRERLDIADSAESNNDWITRWQNALNAKYHARPMPCGSVTPLTVCSLTPEQCVGPAADQYELYTSGFDLIKP